MVSVWFNVRVLGYRSYFDQDNLTGIYIYLVYSVFILSSMLKICCIVIVCNNVQCKRRALCYLIYNKLIQLLLLCTTGNILLAGSHPYNPFQARAPQPLQAPPHTAHPSSHAPQPLPSSSPTAPPSSRLPSHSTHFIRLPVDLEVNEGDDAMFECPNSLPS